MPAYTGPMHRRRLLASAAALGPRALGLAIVPAAIGGCAVFEPRQPLQVSLSALDSLPGQGLEVRLAVTLRFQNPNDRALDYDGLALDLEVNGQHLGSGVSDTPGSLPRFGEALVTVPVSISALGVVRQVWRWARESPGPLSFTARGRLGGGLWGSTAFTSTGRLAWPEAALRS